ncbi:PREDICTED: chitobiosyldiphosphodolichol beta-mannosyltransferase [Ceratosolen solmsi marchali]|uniref:Chitobiosyldiphosphodolichol beta-mannosyltransferase n=1 Tax=Ceratosolen solmsi marchali TaxID=326594 RepID=A0AAJ7E162_9HYME|nr:PREDICTED: chitobiosyldiphosphodolichol beta-mannosyltransferase [Ceratosolen solmsi marchali]
MEFLMHSFGLSFILGLLLAVCFKRCKKAKSVCIVVLGDIGRSPRMQYHAISFIKEGYSVEIVGYPGTPPLNKLQNDSRVKIHYLSIPPNLNSKLITTIFYAFKVFWQSINLSYSLFLKCNSSYLLLQNPPAIPSMPICWFYCYITRTKLAIDWHNYAYSVMIFSLSEKHILIKLATIIEAFFGGKAMYNFCVTKAMKDDLDKKWSIRAKVLYDRPPDNFHPISLKEKHKLFIKLSKEYNIFKGTEKNSTIFTRTTVNKEIELQVNKPALVMSSTSWTKDEDFSILLDALNDYNNECVLNKYKEYPDLICVISGKGPLKAFYSNIIEKKNWNHVKVLTPWLENEDYPKLLASADLGVCLHKSSSGVDLPIKIVDMFGCGLPVCAYNFKCLNELVKDNKNGFIFSNAEELSTQLKLWFKNFSQQQKNNLFRDELIKFQQLRWHKNWINKALPSFEI